MSGDRGLEALRDALERTVDGVARIVDMPFNEYELAVLIVPLDPAVTPILLRAVIVERSVPTRRRVARDAGIAVLDIVDALVADDARAYAEWDSRLGSLFVGNGIVGLMVSITKDEAVRLNEAADPLGPAPATVSSRP